MIEYLRWARNMLPDWFFSPAVVIPAAVVGLPLGWFGAMVLLGGGR